MFAESRLVEQAADARQACGGAARRGSSVVQLRRAAALVRQHPRIVCVPGQVGVLDALETASADATTRPHTTPVYLLLPARRLLVLPAMSTAVWPPIEAAALASEQTRSQQRELEWLLVQLRETLHSLKAGLEECAALLAPSENGSTLVLTSVRSESLKGLVTRIGTRIVKGVCSAAAPPARHHTYYS